MHCTQLITLHHVLISLYEPLSVCYIKSFWRRCLKHYWSVLTLLTYFTNTLHYRNYESIRDMWTPFIIISSYYSITEKKSNCHGIGFQFSCYLVGFILTYLVMIYTSCLCVFDCPIRLTCTFLVFPPCVFNSVFVHSLFISYSVSFLV